MPSPHARVYSGLLACQKVISLYPRKHPRVRRSLGAIQDVLEEYFGQTGQPLVLGSGGGDEAVAGLLRLLQVHLIEKLILRPGITEDELFQLCLLLHEDLSGTPQVAEEGRFDPGGWDHIELCFYSLRDACLPFAGDAAELAEDGEVQRGQPFSRLFEDLPDAVRARVRDALKEPALQQRLSDLHSCVEKYSSRVRGSSKPTYDVVGGVLKQLLAELVQSDAARLDQEHILLSLDNLIAVVENNADLLARETRSYESAHTAPEQTQQMARALAEAPDLSRNVRQLQEAKKKLASLFHTTPESPAASGDTGGEGAGSPATREPPKPPARPPGNAERKAPETMVEPLEERFAAIDCDLDELRGSIQENDEYRQYLQIVMEMLRREEYREEVRKNWDSMKARLLERADQEEYRDFALTDLAGHLGGEDLPEAKELFLAFLFRARSGSRVPAWLEEAVTRPEKAEEVEHVLDALIQEDRDDAIRLLAHLHRRGGKPVRDLVRDRLLTMSKYPGLLSLWAGEDPRGLVAPETAAALVARIGRKGLQRAFDTYFRHADYDQAAEILENVTAGLPAAEQIVFSAMASRRASIRELAILQLPKISSPVALDLLKEVVRANNFRAQPRLPEVKAALKVLVGMGEDRAWLFLNEVANKRGWLQYEYRKEIRNALAEVTKGKTRSDGKPRR
jgi:hypothetical protein